MNQTSASVRRTARIDLSVFRTNLAALLADDDSFVLDARANAFGHGLVELSRVALDVGVTTIRVSPAEAQLPGVRRSALMTVPTRRRLVGAEAYGLDGRHTPVMTLVGEVISVKHVPADAGVSYGYTYRTPEPTTLALVALGYADGVPRLASNRASVAIAGSVRPLVGRVAMDQFVVDLGGDEPTVGHEAVLFGDAAAGHPVATDWAVHTERSPLELTAGIGSRVERVYS